MSQAMVIYGPEDRKHVGKAMQALPDDEYLFVCALLDSAAVPTRDSVKRACRISGFAESTGPALMRRPRVLAAIEELTGLVLKQTRLNAAQRVQDVVDNPTHKDHFKAVKYVLELGGHVVQSEQKITVEHSGQSGAEARAELRQLMAQMGPEALRVLAAADVEVVDAEFTMIDKNAVAPDGEAW